MKTLIQLMMVALIFGGFAAAGTVFMQQRATSLTAADDEHAKAAAGKSASSVDSETPSADAGEHDATAEHSLFDEPADRSTKVDEQTLLAAEPPRGVQAVPLPTPLHAADSIPDTSTSTDRPEARVAVRPPYSPDGDEAGAMINVLRERARAAAETERKLAERQDAMHLIFEDLRTEQARTLKIRQRLANELKESRQAVDAALKAVDTERSLMLKEQADARKAADDAVRAANVERDKLKKQLDKSASSPADANKGDDFGGTPEENANLKKMAGVFDSMPTENVAKVFAQLVKNKKTTAVVSLMNAMKERQAAKVLAAIADSNPELAADLSDRLKRLKSPIAKPANE